MSRTPEAEKPEQEPLGESEEEVEQEAQPGSGEEWVPAAQRLASGDEEGGLRGRAGG